MKTVCVLVLGWILLDSVLTTKNIIGMLTAVLGMVVYSWAVEKEKRAEVAPQPVLFLNQTSFITIAQPLDAESLS